MSSIISSIISTGTDLTSRISDLAIDFTGTRTHNIVDPCCGDSVIRKPSLPLCTSIPGGQLEQGSLLALIATPTSSFGKSKFRIDFILEKCEHAQRSAQVCSKKHRGGGASSKASTSDKKKSDDLDSLILDGSDVFSNAQQSMSECDKASTSAISNQQGAPTSADGGDQVDCISLNSSHSTSSKNRLTTKRIAFHFNPRFSRMSEHEVVVMNSLLSEDGKTWDEEIREEHRFPFNIGETFKMMILVEKESFRVAVDGRHCYEFKHRCDFKDIGRIHIEGNLSIDLLEFRKELKYLTRSRTGSPNEADPFALSRSPSSASESSPLPPSKIHSKVVSSPALPYWEYEPNLGKCHSYNIYIAGMMPNRFKRNFIVNLIASKTADTTIPFHMSIRPDVQHIVRNSMKNGAWASDEELYLEGPFPFILGTHFDLMIAVKREQISVAVNGQLAFEFKQRMEHSIIDVCEITGSPLITSIRYEFF